MTVRDLVSVMDDTQEVMIVSKISYVGIHRYLADDIPPTFLGATVHKVFPHNYGSNSRDLELTIELEDA